MILGARVSNGNIWPHYRTPLIPPSGETRVALCNAATLRERAKKKEGGMCRRTRTTHGTTRRTREECRRTRTTRTIGRWQRGRFRFRCKFRNPKNSRSKC